MTRPTATDVLDVVNGYIAGMSWQDVLVVKRALNDHLGHQADIRQAAQVADPEGATA